MLIKIMGLFNSKKTALWLLAAVAVLALVFLYLRPTVPEDYLLNGIHLTLALLSVNLVACSAARLKPFLRSGRESQETGTARSQVPHQFISPGQESGTGTVLPLGTDRVQTLVTKFLSDLGCLATVSGNQIKGEKNRFSTLWSVMFHLGMVIVLLGFVIGWLWGFKGTVFIPEGVMVKLPEDLRISKRGMLFSEPPGFHTALNRFTYGPDSTQGAPLRPAADMVFMDGNKEVKKRLRINYPARFKGTYWEYQDSGYSLFLHIASNDKKVLVNDFVNIASKGTTKWGDVVPVSQDMELEIRFFPDFEERDTGEYGSKGVFPNNPVMELFIKKKGEEGRRLLLPLGSTVSDKGFQAAFREYRHWLLFDVGSDPGRAFILAGSLLTVLGLSLRTLFVPITVVFRVDSLNENTSELFWQIRAKYGDVVIRKQVAKFVGILGEIKGDSGTN